MHHIDSFLRITFQGLFIIARRNNPAQWEIGLPSLPYDAEHRLTIDLTQRVGTQSYPIAHGIPVNAPLIAIEPDPAPGVTWHEGMNFNRYGDTGDPDDYRWLIDMEHPTEFHNKKLKKRSGGAYTQEIIVRGGELYTHAKTDYRYKRFKKANPPSHVFELGKLASIAGIEIGRAANRNVSLFPGTTTLRQSQDIRYELTFKHMPAYDPHGQEAHYHHYYNVLKDDTGLQFGVIHVGGDPSRGASHHSAHQYPQRDAAVPEHHQCEAESNDPRQKDVYPRGNEPQVCNAVLLGKTEDGLPR